MHDIPAMEVGNTLADVSEILFDFGMRNTGHFDFVEQSTALSIL